VSILLLQFFAETGFPCPSRRNPSDHFLRCVNSDFDDVATALKGSMKLRAVRSNLRLIFVCKVMFWYMLTCILIRVSIFLV
jgi:hypothetical protein